MHATQARKGTHVPYAPHVIGVSSLVSPEGEEKDDWETPKHEHLARLRLLLAAG